MEDLSQQHPNSIAFRNKLLSEVKHYKPGCPEWDEIVKTITPIERVRKGQKTLILAERAPTTKSHRRGEDRELLR